MFGGHNKTQYVTLCLSCVPNATLLASSTVSHTKALPQANIKAFLTDGISYLIISTTNLTFLGSLNSLKAEKEGKIIFHVQIHVNH